MTRLSSLWGKARPAGSGGKRYHPLLWHLLDVAAVGCAVLDRDEPLRAALSRTFDLDAQALRRWVGFFLALHDIGKASRLFQATVPELWPEVFAEPPPRPLSAPPHHTELGLDLLLERIGEELDPVFEQWRNDLRELLLTPVLAHHGRPRRAPDTLVQVEAWGSRGLAIGRFLVRLLLGLFDPPAPSPPGRRELARASWRLAGLVTLADWIASAQRWFPYEDPDHDPKAYLETIARPRAERALAEAGTGRASPAPALGTEALVGPDARPTPLQRAVAEIPLPEGPALFLIEEQTGAGKTEAALSLAHRLMAERAARGLYLALPTMATANAMFARMGASGRRLFAEKEPPSLALAHSRAALHEGFVAVPVPFDEPDEKAGDGDEAGREARAWLADDRRKTFLADLGVGTLDQALLAVLPASFQALRLLGLAERVLVVDEAHAYDAYTTGLLARLLRFQAALGGSAIVLSATLPLSIRRELVDAFLRGLDQKGGSVACRAYPLLTIASAGGIAERPVAPRAELARRIAVQRLPNEEEALAAVGEAAAAGAAVLWIRNTVDEAIASQARLAENGIKAELFHARFATGDRLVREQEVLRRFGKHAAPEARRGVLVATQVVEQSLDLDFDLIVTDLAPIDCLVQRAGRLWRHPGRSRPLPAPRFLVLAPDPVDAPARDWIAGFLPGTAAVYRDHLRLWRSARALFARCALEIPGDVRALVEEVYAENGEVPEGLERNWYASDGERKAARALARQNALDPDRGYLPHGVWDSDVRTPTRLGEPMITLRLARFEGGRIEPWCTDPDPRRAWALSEVQVRQARVREALLPQGCTKELVDAVRRSWGRFEAPDLFGGRPREDLSLLPLVRARGEAWVGSGVDGKGEPVALRYDRASGLSLG